VTVITIIGAGPRGSAVLERLGANFAVDVPAGGIELHIVDPFTHGPGRVWHRDQPRELVMNTLAGEVTLFTSEGLGIAGPVVEGPTLYQWCMLAAGRDSEVDISPAERAAYLQRPVAAGELDEGTRAELAMIRPWSHPSRIIYGDYLAWYHRRVLALLPPTVRVHTHFTSATDVRRDGAAAEVTLADGTLIRSDAVVLALGWLSSVYSPRDVELQRDLRAAGLTWVAPASPLEQNLDVLEPGETVIVRGLGMGFFDSMALLSIGRGGRFSTTAGGGLHYHPSGREPILAVGSRRGIPFRSKSLFHSLTPGTEQFYLKRFEAGRATPQADFVREALPQIKKDAVREYYRTLARVRPDALRGDVEEFLAELQHHDVDSGQWRAREAAAVPAASDRCDLDQLLDPVPRGVASAAEFQQWVADYIDEDLSEGLKGRDSPMKAAARSLSGARGPMARVAAFGGLWGNSHVTDYSTFMAAAGMLGSGPPAFRLAQLRALMAAGLVRFIGPELGVRVDAKAGRIIAASARFADSEVSGTALLDAWMQSPELAGTTDPLLRSLFEQGLARPYSIADEDGEARPTGSVQIDPLHSRLVHRDGQQDAAIFLIGIPAAEVRGSSIASPIPNSGNVFLKEVDAVAGAILTQARNTSPHAEPVPA